MLEGEPRLSAVPEAEGLDDRALVAQAPDDPLAFAELYRRHVGAIHAFAWRRSGSRQVAEDVTSATFERALASIDRFEWKGGGFVAWLHRIAANELAAHHRREARVDSPRGQSAFLALVPSEPVDGDDPLADWPRVRAALDRLRPRYQEVIALRYLAGLSADDAAVALGLSKPVLAVTLHRALRALEREVGR
ncbi:MAG: polymerase ECF-type sigma factor [Actinomycetia bacterium]|nr:polymerase ECF-type sigma factor [Actinomycetes bacterium]